MGGLLAKMKVTGITFIFGALAIAGVPPLSGFWSKDEILFEALNNNHPVLFAVVVLTSFLTAFYMSRLIFLVLFGSPRTDLHAQESPKTMTVPLVILAVFSVVAGFIGSPLMHHAFQKFIFLGPEGGLEHPQPTNFIMGLSTIVSLAGIGLAYSFYVLNNKILPVSLRSRFSSAYQLVLNKYYFDQIYERIFIQPCLKACHFLFKFDAEVVDGVVNGVGRMVQFFSQTLRRLQTGLVQNYMLVQIFGVIVFILILLVSPYP